MGSILDVITDIIVFIVIEQILARVIGRMFGSPTVHSSRAGYTPRAEAKKQTIQGEAVRDPVCGMFVSTELARRLDWRGKTLYFCSQECLEQYRKSAPA